MSIHELNDSSPPPYYSIQFESFTNRLKSLEVERSKLKISSGLWPKHAVKEDLLERADAALLYEAAELGDRTVWKTTGE